MAFFAFPARHWQSIRTSNPIKSAFATIRHRTKRSKGCLSRDGMLHMPLMVCYANHCRPVDVQAGALRRGKLAEVTQLRLSGKSHNRCQVHRRYRNHKQSGRRMIRKSQTPDLTITLKCLPLARAFSIPKKMQHNLRSSVARGRELWLNLN